MFSMMSTFFFNMSLMMFFCLMLYVSNMCDFIFFYNIFNFDWMNISYYMAVDILSMFFLILSLFLLFVCIMLNWYLSYSNNMFLLLMIFTMFCLFNIFLTMDIFLLFFFFEFMVFPLFLIVGMWGSSTSKMYAAYQLFLFTMIGSIFILISFLYLYSMNGSSNYLYFSNMDNKMLLFWFIFIGFSVKVPIVPLHMWLPEAHVEAPTVGSVILAGMVLKLSFYVYYSLLFCSFSDVFPHVMDFLFVMFMISIFLSSFFSIAQMDMKKMMAYSSISHMNYSLIGLFSGNLMAVMGCIFMMFGHAMVSSALFISMGVIYDSYKTSLLFYYSSLNLMMPVFMSFFFIFMLANFGMPGTINFVGEFIVFLGSFIVNNVVVFFTTFGMFLTMVYSLFLYNSMSSGPFSSKYMYFFSDMSSSEFYILFIFVFFMIMFGIFPNIFFDLLSMMVMKN